VPSSSGGVGEGVADHGERARVSTAAHPPMWHPGGSHLHLLGAAPALQRLVLQGRRRAPRSGSGWRESGPSESGPGARGPTGSEGT
jgi:hypothetical protein